QEVNRKERSLRILGKHLSGIQKGKKQVEERLQRAEEELSDKFVYCEIPPPFAALSSSLHVSLPVQSFLSAVSQLCHTCSSRIDWLEQEVSAHRSHVTALRSELQDACLRDNLISSGMQRHNRIASFNRFDSCHSDQQLHSRLLISAFPRKLHTNTMSPVTVRICEVKVFPLGTKT
uniref:Coiled-coil domain containing 171 n=1 Tax=Maylandia zebra TaxID=106582 RepID=A0A3P9DRL1_9CICH